jgi:hypothetical protein
MLLNGFEAFAGVGAYKHAPWKSQKYSLHSFDGDENLQANRSSPALP